MTDNGGCDHHCQYDGRMHWCECTAGFELQKDGKSCKGVYNLIN